MVLVIDHWIVPMVLVDLKFLMWKVLVLHFCSQGHSRYLGRVMCCFSLRLLLVLANMIGTENRSVMCVIFYKHWIGILCNGIYVEFELLKVLLLEGFPI